MSARPYAEGTNDAIGQKVAIETIEAINEIVANDWTGDQDKLATEAIFNSRLEIETIEAIETIDAREAIDTSGAIEASDATKARNRRCDRNDELAMRARRTRRPRRAGVKGVRAGIDLTGTSGEVARTV